MPHVCQHRVPGVDRELELSEETELVRAAKEADRAAMAAALADREVEVSTANQSAHDQFIY